MTPTAAAARAVPAISGNLPSAIGVFASVGAEVFGAGAAVVLLDVAAGFVAGGFVVAGGLVVAGGFVGVV